MNRTFYCKSRMQEQVNFIENYKFLKDDVLSYTSVPNGIIYPHSMPKDTQNMRGIGGVYDDDFRVVKNAQTLHSIDGKISVVCGGEAPPPLLKVLILLVKRWFGLDTYGISGDIFYPTL